MTLSFDQGLCRLVSGRWAFHLTKQIGSFYRQFLGALGIIRPGWPAA